MEIAQDLAPSALQVFLSQYLDPSIGILMDFVLQEAQRISNPDARQSQALQRLEAAHSIPNISELTGEQVLERLRRLHEQVVADCTHELNTFLKEPNYMAYAMVAEFVDRVLRSGRQSLGDVKDDWEIFLGKDEVRPLVWVEFQQLDVRKQEQEAWNRRVDAVMAANGESAYCFLR
jgi:hypothetical protein